jgi:threonine aldolase
VFNFEAAGAAVVGGIQLRTLPNGPRGVIDPDAIRGAIRPKDDHEPPTGGLVLENSHNRRGGGVQTLDEVNAAVAVAHEHDVPVHLDGARLFNAATALGVPAWRIVERVDSVSFCLSKGLGAPVGSVLCGTRDFIERARHWRKLLGGGMRQVGVIAAAGIVAIETGINRLHLDHEAAQQLAHGLAAIDGIDIDVATVQTNIVNFDMRNLPLSPTAFIAELNERGVKLAANSGSQMRAVTSSEVDFDDIEYALSVIGAIARGPAVATSRAHAASA